MYNNKNNKTIISTPAYEEFVDPGKGVKVSNLKDIFDNGGASVVTPTPVPMNMTYGANGVDYSQTQRFNADVSDGGSVISPFTGSSSMLNYYSDAAGAVKDNYDATMADIKAKTNSLLEEIKKNKEDAITYAENSRKQIYEDATAARERAILDANNTYAQNMSNYGAKAEALRAMGLTGGGYSEHLDALAYAANRDDIQAARAVEADTRKAADRAFENAQFSATSEADKLTYDANIKKLEQEINAASARDSALLGIDEKAASYKSGIFQELLGKASTGNLSKEQVDSLVNVFGFNEDEKNALYASVDQGNASKSKEAAATYETNYGIFKKNIYEDPFGYTDADVDRWVTIDGVSPELGEKLKDDIRKERSALLSSLISNGDIDGFVSTLDGAYNNGNGIISKEEYQAEYGKFANSVAESISTDTEVGDVVSVCDSLKQLRDNENISEDVFKSTMKSIADKIGATVIEQDRYSISPHSGGAYMRVHNKDGIKSLGEDNYKLSKLSKNDPDPKILSALVSSVGESGFVTYDGKIYGNDGETWYKVTGTVTNHIKNK